MFDEVRLSSESLMACGNAALSAIAETVSVALVGLAADSAGGMKRALVSTVAHLRTRKQFGQSLSDQPVLQHRIVEHYRGWLGLRALVQAAARDWPSASCGESVQRARAAKALAGWAGKALALDAIQLHGAIGMQDECAVSHFAKRLVTNDTLFGDAQSQLERYAASSQA